MQPTPEPNPTPAGSAAPPVVGQPLVEFVRADRQRAAYILMALGALLLALGAWSAFKATRTPAAAADTQKDQPPGLEELTPVKPTNPNRNAYILGALIAGLGVLGVLVGGGWMLVSPPPPDLARQKTEARTVILGTGGMLGALLMIAGIVYFYLWRESLSNWLDKEQMKEAKFVLIPLLAVAVGALVMFLAILPARAEERDNRFLRRCIYGANLGLSVLLLFVALVVFNMIVGPQVPNKLDVTATGFYTLSAGSKDFLGRLPEPVKAYAILPEGRRADDIRRLLQNAQDTSGGKFTTEFISPVSDQIQYRALAAKYPVIQAHEVEGSTLGVLLTVGEDEKRHSFIRDDEFVQGGARNPMTGQSSGPQSFVGESRLMRQLLFLAENEKKAVVYFTQSAGELDIGDAPPEGAGGESGTARQLKEYLTRNYLDVRPLKFDLQNPTVPDDASVVVVAEPGRPLDEAHANAIRKYMTEPRGTRKGKLILLSGATFGPPPKQEVLRTGLEGLLKEFNVGLEQRVVVGLPTRELDPYTAVAGFSVASRRARNPVSMALGEKAQFLSFAWRQVAPVQGGPAYRAIPLLYTADRDRYTWLEDHGLLQAELNQAIKELLKTPSSRAAKQFTDEPRPVGVAVSETDPDKGEVGRVVVVGNGILVSDAYAQQSGGVPPGFDLVGGSIDWLRDRPPLAYDVENKKYVEFKFPATTDDTRGLYLPLLLSVVAVAGLGLSVWMVRSRAL